MNPLMNVNALSREEQSYLLGLYFTDGSFRGVRRSGSHQRVKIVFQWNEREMVDRVATLLKHCSLIPRIYDYGDCITVSVSSTNLCDFFPDKHALLKDESARRRFLGGGNNLHSRENGAAFCAGLLDGDGSCHTYLYPNKADMERGWIGSGGIRVIWLFSQNKYPFLIDFFHEFVESLAPNSNASGVSYRQDGSPYSLHVNRRGVDVLMQAGIDKWSWKVKKCVESRSKLLEEREMEKQKMMRRVMSMGVKISDVAKTLGVRRSMLYKSFRRGKLQATLVCSWGGQRYLMIPREEVERLKKERGS
nr:helix-turn-helix domain-containing protein [Candidatus Njordarchaeota archaeon]